MFEWGFNNRQNASSLIEVLVTMVIVAVGLLGQAALMAQSSKSSSTALMRSQATLMSYDILERMRLNRAYAIAGNFNTQPFTIPATALNKTGIAIVDSELADWERDLNLALPNGYGQVTVILANQGGTVNDYLVTITISWSEVTKGLDTNGNAVPTTTTQFQTQSLL